MIAGVSRTAKSPLVPKFVTEAVPVIVTPGTSARDALMYVRRGYKVDCNTLVMLGKVEQMQCIEGVSAYLVLELNPDQVIDIFRNNPDLYNIRDL